MVVYTERGITYCVRWAKKPFIIRQGDGRPPVRLVAVRLAGDVLQVGVDDPPGPVRWADPGLYLDEHEAEAWARKGFGAKATPAPGGRALRVRVGRRSA